MLYSIQTKNFNNYLIIYLDGKKSCSFFLQFIIISTSFYKPFQRIVDMDIKSYIKYLYIFYGILVIFLNFKIHYIGGGEIKDSDKKPIIFRGG